MEIIQEYACKTEKKLRSLHAWYSKADHGSY